MRAVTVSDYGARPVVMELPIPEAGPGQVLIKLAAAGMNPMDAKLASGEWRPEPATFPMVLGVDGAGTVDSLGEGQLRLPLLARSPKNPKVLRRRDRLLNQGCLADARLSQHHDRPAVAVPRPGQQPVQHITLALPTEQHLSSPLLAWAWTADTSSESV